MQPSDVRMIEVGQSLTFVAESTDYVTGGEPSIDQLDRHCLRILVIGSLPHIDCSHASRSDTAKHFVSSDLAADARVISFGELREGFESRRLENSRHDSVRREKRLDLGSKARIVATLLLKTGGALGWLEVINRLEQFPRPVPALFVQFNPLS